MPLPRLLTSLGPALILLGACSGPLLGPTPKPGPKRPPPKVVATVTVTEQPAQDRWEVLWELPTSIEGVRFRLQDTPWTLAGAEATAHVGGGDVRVVAADGSRLRRFAAHLPRSAAPAVAYGDGTHLLPTAALVVTPLRCERQGGCSPADLTPTGPYLFHRWRLRAAPDRHLAAFGEASVGQLDVDQRDGTYPRGDRVVFAQEAVPTTPTHHQLFDAALPKWLATDAADVAPKLLASHAERMGRALPTLPTLRIARTDAALPGRFDAGDADAAGALLVLRGAGWDAFTDGNRNAFRVLLARRLLELWLPGSLTVRGAWVAEGAPAWLSLQTLGDLGLLERGPLSEVVARAANECLLSVRGGPWSGGACGLVGHAVLDHALTDTGGTKALYAGLLADPDLRGLTAASVLASAGAASADVARWLSVGLAADADVAVQRALRAAGLDVVLAAPSEAAVDPARLRRLLVRTLTSCDCDRPLVASPIDGGVAIPGHPTCDVFREGYPLAAVDGHGVADEPARAWEALADAIDRIARVPLARTDDGKERTIKCPIASLDLSWTRLLAVP